MENKVKISDICIKETGIAYKSQDFTERNIGTPVVLLRDFDHPTYTQKDLINLNNYQKHVWVNRGDILISKTADIKLCLWEGERSVLNQNAMKLSLTSGNNVDKKYLLYFLANNLEHIKRRLAGATIKFVREGEIMNMEILLPPLPEQKRIVEILEKADTLRKKRREADELMSKSLMNFALSIFGEPIRNHKKWEVRKFNEIALLERGRFDHRPRNEPRFYGGKYPFIQINDITRSGMVIRDYSQTLNEKGLAISKIFPVNTIVVSIASTIGEAGILGFDSCFPDSLVGIAPKEGVVTKEYIYFYLIYMKSHLNEIAPQLAQKNINLKILNNLGVPVPDFIIQQKFAALVQKAERIKEAQRESKQELESLFRVIMQKAFQG